MRGKPGAELAEVQIPFVTTQDECLNLVAQGFQSGQCCVRDSRDRVVVEGHAIVPSNRFEPMWKSAENFDCVSNYVGLDGT